MAELKTKNCHCCGGSGAEFDHKLVGDYMRDLRMKRKITLTRVAGRMRISKPYLSDLEHGYRNWRNALIRRYRKAIGLTV